MKICKTQQITIFVSLALLRWLSGRSGLRGLCVVVSGGEDTVAFIIPHWSRTIPSKPLLMVIVRKLKFPENIEVIMSYLINWPMARLFRSPMGYCSAEFS